jgi:hypothetical protein
LPGAAWQAIWWLNWHVGGTVGDFTVIALLLAAPLGLAALGYQLARPARQHYFSGGVRRGQAFVAGVCMATLFAGIALGLIHYACLRGRPIELVGVVLASALATGYLGSRLGRELEARSGASMPRAARRFYQGILGLGLAHGTLLWCGGTLWGTLASWIPAAGPLGLAEALDPDHHLPVLVLANAFALLGTSLFLPLAARVIREVLPEIEPGTLVASLALPAFGPALWVSATYGPILAGLQATPRLWAITLGLWVLALAVHGALAFRLGSGRRSGSG